MSVESQSSSSESEEEAPPTPKGKKGKKRDRDRKRRKGKSKENQYSPLTMPSSKDLLNVYKLGLAQADRAFHKDLAKNPLPVLAAVIGILASTEDNEHLSVSDKERVGDAILFLAERINTLIRLADPSAPTVNFADALPRGEGGRRKGPVRTLLHDVARGLARRVPLTKLV